MSFSGLAVIPCPCLCFRKYYLKMGHKVSVLRVKATVTVPSTVPRLDEVVLTCRRNSCWRRCKRLIASFTFPQNAWQQLGDGVLQNASGQDTAVPLARLEGKDPKTPVKVVCLSGSNPIVKARLSLGDLLAVLREAEVGKSSTLHFTVASAGQHGLMLCVNGRVCAVDTHARALGKPTVKDDNCGSTQAQEMGPAETNESSDAAKSEPEASGVIDKADKADDEEHSAKEGEEKALKMPIEVPTAVDEKEASEMADEVEGEEDILFMPLVIRYDLSPCDTLAGHRKSFMVRLSKKALARVRSIRLEGVVRRSAAISSARLWVNLVTLAGWAFTALICYITWLEHSGQ